jgi:purine-binding chemotaxis protein CheW
MSAEYLRVRVGAEHYALPVEHVVEIVELGRLTPVPGAAETVLGLRNLRGEVLAAIDLAGLLGIEGDGAAQGLVVTAAADRRAGLVVDEVLGVGPLPDFTDGTFAPCISATVVVDGELVGVFSTPALLDAIGGGGPR